MAFRGVGHPRAFAFAQLTIRFHMILAESGPGLTEGDLVMIALTVFFGIFIVTAAIWGPLYFIRKARRQRRADPETQTAGAAPSEYGRSDHATVDDSVNGPSTQTPPWIMSLYQRFDRLLDSLPGMLRISASRNQAHLWPLDTLETGRRFDDIGARIPEVPELDERRPNGVGPLDPLDPLADIEIVEPNPAANGQVNVDEINDLVALQARCEPYLAPIDLNQAQPVDLNLVQVHGNDEEQQEEVDDLRSEPSRSVRGAVSMTTITRWKTG